MKKMEDREWLVRWAASSAPPASAACSHGEGANAHPSHRIHFGAGTRMHVAEGKTLQGIRVYPNAGGQGKRSVDAAAWTGLTGAAAVLAGTHPGAAARPAVMPQDIAVGSTNNMPLTNAAPPLGATLNHSILDQSFWGQRQMAEHLHSVKGAQHDVPLTYHVPVPAPMTKCNEANCSSNISAQIGFLNEQLRHLRQQQVQQQAQQQAQQLNALCMRACSGSVKKKRSARQSRFACD